MMLSTVRAKLPAGRAWSTNRTSRTERFSLRISGNDNAIARGRRLNAASVFRAYRRRAALAVNQAHADRVDPRRIPLNREWQHQRELAPKWGGCRALIPTGRQVAQRDCQLRGLQVAPRRGRELDRKSVV